MKRSLSTVSWAARILGIGTAMFLGVFALDAFEAGKTASQVAADFIVHLLPSAMVLAIVALSWRRQWLGAIAFVTLAVGYAVWVGFRPDWTLVVAGPLLTVGLLFFWSWKLHPVR